VLLNPKKKKSPKCVHTITGPRVNHSTKVPMDLLRDIYIHLLKVA
jgi:hypothetical protein